MRRKLVSTKSLFSASSSIGRGAPADEGCDPLGHVVRAVEVRVLEQLEERPLPHDVEDHHVHVDGPAVERPEGDRLLRDDGPEGADVRLVERAGHEAVDEGRLADALLADQADLELVGLRLGLGLQGRPLPRILRVDRG